MVTTITMVKEKTLQEDSILELLRMADWATLCIEAWHEHCPNEISGIDSYLPDLKKAMAQLSQEIGVSPKWCWTLWIMLFDSIKVLEWIVANESIIIDEWIMDFESTKLRKWIMDS